jgi:signal transduction histidine kinase
MLVKVSPLRTVWKSGASATTSTVAGAAAPAESRGAEPGPGGFSSRWPIRLRCGLLRWLQVFQNLIANAIKFVRPDTPPVVRIAAARDGRAWTLSVADNGIGIEAKYFDRIFQMFQRLHGRGEYSGTGIGLALCK